MGFKIKFFYPSGEEEEYDEVYDTEEEAVSVAEDNVLGFSTGADILNDMGRDFSEGDLRYEIFED